MQNIEDLRNIIDSIDDEMIKLLDKRFDAGNKIGQLKAETGKNVFDKSREDYIISKIKNSSAIYSDQIIAAYRHIMALSKDIQNKGL